MIAFKHLGVVPYEQAWDMQRDVHAARVADEIPDTCLLFEHPPVFTAGRRTQDFERPVDGTPVIDVDRGGRMTWHGPGQLVGYPIVRLPMPVDAVGHVRRLEEALIARVRRLRRRGDPDRRPVGGLGAGQRRGSGAQDRRHRRPHISLYDDARVRAELRP